MLLKFKLLFLILFVCFSVNTYAHDQSYYVLSTIQKPAHGYSQSIGSYANGCLIGAVTLPKNGDGFALMRLSRNRYYVHPNLYNFIVNFAKNIKNKNLFANILIGDTGSPIGGPMPSGHASHQNGLDVDVWLMPHSGNILTDRQRENMSSISHVTLQQTMRQSWNKDYTNFVLTAARYKNVSRIFANPAIKRRICADTFDWQKNLDALAKIRPWYGHDSHMHVRLKCPKGSVLCEKQSPPTKHHGCTGNDIDWWFSDEALHPIPSKIAPYQRKLNDLPKKCQELYHKMK